MQPIAFLGDGQSRRFLCDRNRTATFGTARRSDYKAPQGGATTNLINWATTNLINWAITIKI